MSNDFSNTYQCGRLNGGLPKKPAFLISGTCDYASLHGKGHFQMGFKDFEMERLFWIAQLGPM